MGKRQTFTEAQVRRMIKAARAEDPRAVIEIVTDAGTVRITPEPESAIIEKSPKPDGRKPIAW